MSIYLITGNMGYTGASYTTPTDIISQIQYVGNSKEKVNWFLQQINGIKKIECVCEGGGVLS